MAFSHFYHECCTGDVGYAPSQRSFDLLAGDPESRRSFTALPAYAGTTAIGDFPAVTKR